LRGPNFRVSVFGQLSNRLQIEGIKFRCTSGYEHSRSDVMTTSFPAPAGLSTKARWIACIEQALSTLDGHGLKAALPLQPQSLTPRRLGRGSISLDQQTRKDGT
jgi:hypothetical protein